MKQAFDIVNEWLGILTKVAVNLVLLGIIIGVLFPNSALNMIPNLSVVMTQFGEGGFAGLVALAILVTSYQKK